jgi:hypothetical protein
VCGKSTGNQYMPCPDHPDAFHFLKTDRIEST